MRHLIRSLFGELLLAAMVLPLFAQSRGGPVSHYNLPKREQAMGGEVFVKEPVRHVDATYRTIADRKGRGIEGFSQGGRGTTRIMFKHPHLFCSAAPGGAGHSTEKRTSEEYGRENDNFVCAPGYNTWDLARKYAQKPEPSLRILVHVGTKGFNYENNLEYMTFLESLKIPFDRRIVPDVPHSAQLMFGSSPGSVGETVLVSGGRSCGFLPPCRITPS